MGCNTLPLYAGRSRHSRKVDESRVSRSHTGHAAGTGETTCGNLDVSGLAGMDQLAGRVSASS